MDIRFISSLTAEDENRFAEAVMAALGALLDQLPIAYTVRIETIDAQVFQHSNGVAPAHGHHEPEPQPVGPGFTLAAVPES